MRFCKISINLICVFMLFANFNACSDKEQAKKQLAIVSKAEVQEKLNLPENEKRVYILKGKIGANKQMAYFFVGQDVILLCPYSKDNMLGWYTANERKYNTQNIVFQQHLPHFEINNGVLSIKGIDNDGKTYEFIQDTQSNINEISIISHYDYQTNENAKTKEAESKTSKNNENSTLDEGIVEYEAVLSYTFIPDNNLNPQVLSTLRNALGLGAQSKQELNDKIKAEAKAKLAQMQKTNLPPISGPYSYIQNKTISYIDNRILVESNITYEYTGGAHGNSRIEANTYSLENGQDLSRGFKRKLDMLIAPDLRARFADFITEKIKEENYYDSLFESTISEKKLTDVFLVNNLDVRFVWQPYELGPYSLWHIELKIPLEDIKPFLASNSPFKYLFE